MREPRLTIVTDNARRAALRMFGAGAPAWARIIDDPMDILAIPDRAKCFGLWFGPRLPRSAAEQAWLERRLTGGLDFMSDGDWDRFFAWRDGEPAATAREAVADEPVNPLLTQVWM